MVYDSISIYMKYPEISKSIEIPSTLVVARCERQVVMGGNCLMGRWFHSGVIKSFVSGE